MATIRKEFSSPKPAADVWAVLKDFGAVHELARGFVTATTLEEGGKVRLVTFANGMQVREHLVSADDAQRRLVYAITDSPRYSHYSASAQVVEEGARQPFRLDRGFPAGRDGRHAERRHGRRRGRHGQGAGVIRQRISPLLRMTCRSACVRLSSCCG